MPKSSLVSNVKGRIGYVVSVWPRLSETFILNEVLAVEGGGVPLRIFSVKNPVSGPVHARAGDVRAGVTCLGGVSGWRQALGPGLRLARRHPRRLLQTLLQAISYRRWDGGRRLCQAVCLADLLSREPLTRLHAHFAHAPALVAMLTHGLTGIPYSFTAHAKDIYVKTPPELLRAEIKHAQAVVTCTEYNRRYLVDEISPASRCKVHRIYHGVDLAQFRFRPTLRPAGQPPVILSVARLVEKKGLRDLIAAADVLRRRGRCFQVEIIGDGPLLTALQAQRLELGLHDQVRLLGAQPQEMVCLAYQRASIFALPCVIAADGDRDGIPNVLLEAMASGVPVVSTPVSGIPELIESEREGLLAEPHNPASLAEALDRLLTQPELGERLARAARARVEASFSVEAGARKLLELFGREPAGQPSASGFEATAASGTSGVAQRAENLVSLDRSGH